MFTLLAKLVYEVQLIRLHLCCLLIQIWGLKKPINPGIPTIPEAPWNFLIDSVVIPGFRKKS